ncbi:phosphoenolpyruvate carboxykinase (ATP) [soil metagenome]
MHRIEELQRSEQGKENGPQINLNLSRSELQSAAVARGEGELTVDGVLSVDTRPDTGRSPKDKFVVEGTEGIDYGTTNQPLSRDHFNGILESTLGNLYGQDELFVNDFSVGADNNYNRGVRLVTPKAWSAQFATNLFLPARQDYTRQQGGYTILHAPEHPLRGEDDGVNSNRGIITDFERKLIVISGTKYAGEIKKAMFSAMQYELPREGVATMHCSANMARNGEVALFFGLSGTGKTTLSTEPDRMLIGDDEHGWSDDGVFNFEGGSYAKLINLSQTAEPLIYNAVHRRGTVLENATDSDDLSSPNFSQGLENMRGAFSLDMIPGASKYGIAGHPKDIIMLTADATGVLPPMAKLSPQEAIYHYLAGYTSKVAGTERGITKPESTFSACFGSPFLTLPAERYGELLAEKIATHKPNLWLVNTGWPGGYKDNGRMSIEHTRNMVSAILNHEVSSTFEQDGLGFYVPTEVSGVPSDALRAENYWDDSQDYRERAMQLAADFVGNARQFDGRVPQDILASGPQFA